MTALGISGVGMIPIGLILISSLLGITFSYFKEKSNRKKEKDFFQELNEILSSSDKFQPEINELLLQCEQFTNPKKKSWFKKNKRFFKENIFIIIFSTIIMTALGISGVDMIPIGLILISSLLGITFSYFKEKSNRKKEKDFFQELNEKLSSTDKFQPEINVSNLKCVQTNSQQLKQTTIQHKEEPKFDQNSLSEINSSKQIMNHKCETLIIKITLVKKAVISC